MVVVMGVVVVVIIIDNLSPLRASPLRFVGDGALEMWRVIFLIKKVEIKNDKQ